MPGMNGLETLDKLPKSPSPGALWYSAFLTMKKMGHRTETRRGWLSVKRYGTGSLLKALHQAAAGEMVLSEALSLFWPPACVLTVPLLSAMLTVNPTRARYSQADCPGFAEQEIARRLDITESTVKVHVKHMRRK